MRELSESATALTIGYPAWLGLACIAVTYALSWWFFTTAHRTKSPIAQRAAGIGGIIVGTVVGYGALTDNLTLDANGAREQRLLTVQSAAWKEVAEVALEQRTSGKSGKLPHLVLRKTPYGEMSADISGLSPEEIERVLAFARKRAGGS